MIQILEVKADHQINPAGLSSIPKFSWKLGSDKKNTIQKSYCLQIAEDNGFQKIVMQKEENAKNSVNISPDFFILESLKEYFYRVKIISTKGEVSAWSETGCFTTAFLSSEEWNGVFITAEKEEEKEHSKGTLLRKDVSIKGGVKKAYILSTALGVYHLYLNGNKVGKDALAPGWTSYHKHLLYQMYDVTTELKNGENAIGAMIGAGWYKGLMGFLGLRNNYGTRTALLFQMEVFYKDGSRDSFCSDDTWLGKDAPVLFSEIYDGEIYDARQYDENWCMPESHNGEYKQIETVPFDYKALTSQPGCRICRNEILPVKEIIHTKRGETVLDFGQNMTGFVRFLAAGQVGEKIELQCFEILDAIGNVYTDNLRTAKQTLIYYCDGNKRWYEPYFTFQGFRYVKIISYPEEIKKEHFQGIVLHSEMERTGYFECSNTDINQLHHNVLWSLKGNFLDVPTDCPQRNERVGWTGDAQIFCRTAGYLMDTYQFFRKWLTDLSCDQTAEGGVPHIIPDIITGKEKDDWLVKQGTHSAAAWADAAVLNPWNLYQAFGDVQILERQYKSMKAWIDFMRNHAEGVRWTYRLQFGDWVALDAEEGSYFGATPTDFTCAAYYIHSTEAFVRTAKVLDKNEDYETYGQLVKELREDFLKQFVREDGTLTANTQTAHILALYFQLMPKQYIQKTVENLCGLLEKEHEHLVTGFVGTPYITHALSQNGKIKEAYDLLLKDDFPSWLYQVKMGATSIWEHWDGIKPDGTMWSPDMNSFNHYAYGAIAEWLYRVVAGIETDENYPGFERILICPHIGGNLEFVKASYESVYGRISIHWMEENDMVKLHVEIPANTTAEIRLIQVATLLEANDLNFSKSEKGYIAECGSGSYTMRYIREEQIK